MEIIRACPHCRFPIREKVVDFASGQNLSGVYWTDGKVHLPFFPLSSRLVRCENCSRYYWKRNAAVVGTCDPESAEIEKQPEAWEHVWIKDSFPTIEDSISALDLRVYENDAQELYVRTLVWWGINDPVRFGKQKHIAKEYQTLFVENLMRLRELYELVQSTVSRTVEAGKGVSIHGNRGGKLEIIENPYHLVECCRLHCGEICRELGDFANAAAYVEGTFELFDREVTELKGLIAQKKGEVGTYSWSQAGKAGPPSEFATGDQHVKNRDKLEKQKRKTWDDFVDIFKQ